MLTVDSCYRPLLLRRPPPSPRLRSPPPPTSPRRRRKRRRTRKRSSTPRRLSRRVRNLSLFPSPYLDHHDTYYTTSLDDHYHPAFRDHHLDARCAHRRPTFPRRNIPALVCLSINTSTTDTPSSELYVDYARPFISTTPRSPTPTRYRAHDETEHVVLTGVLLTECRNSKECAPAKHHYDECVARVTGGGAAEGEDCVEECTFIKSPFPAQRHTRPALLTRNLVRHQQQFSTSPTAPPSAPLPSSGASSNKRSMRLDGRFAFLMRLRLS